MKIYSFDSKQLESNYRKLLDMYHHTTDKLEKIEIYNEIEMLRHYMKNYVNLDILDRVERPEEFDAYNYMEKDNMVKLYREIEELTETLCIFFTNSLRNTEEKRDSLLTQNLSKEEFYDEIVSFFDNVLPNETPIALDSFNGKKIEIKKRARGAHGEMIPLEHIKDYYIKVGLPLFSQKLDTMAVKNTVYCLGHASHLLSSSHITKKDNPFESVIATLYELLYIDYHFKGDAKKRLLEFNKLFKSTGPSLLETYFWTHYYDKYTSMPLKWDDLVLRKELYGDIIALSLFVRRNDKDFQEKLERLKGSSLPLLKDIGLDEQELIYTAKNARRLMLKGE